jgi:cytochrome oxidase Cu insertion factor (SCO1/SenC/PrrC family)
MRNPESAHKLARAVFFATSVLVILTAAVWGIRLFSLHRNQSIAPPPVNLAIGGFPLPGHPAPDFKLVDQFDQPATLSALRGHEIVLAFIDARCTTICPLTAEIMYNAKAQLKSAAASQIELVAVNANPTATSVPVVQAWSITHGMLHQWLFLTGTPAQLQAIYHLYNVYDQVTANDALLHDPIMFIIDAQGRMRLSFETLESTNQADVSSEEAGLVAGMQQWLPQAG